MTNTLRIALVQIPIVWENPQVNRSLLEEKISQISDSDIIILPEMFTSGFTMKPKKIDHTEGQRTIDWMLKIASEKQMAITGSIVFFEEDKYFNRLFFVSPDGKTAHYDKRHTFTLAGETDAYKAGINKLIIDYNGFKICPLICYDLRFPVWARNIESYDVLLYVANWPKPRINAWDTLLKARAIENMAYCIGVNRVGVDESGHEYPGHSAVYDALGKTLVFSKEQEILYTTLYKEHLISTRNKLKFLEDKDHFTLTI
tara:strand:+ start:26413 stop:27186 length:774 start_codon:yes stop_codon:yes gene_type:complete